MTPNYIEPLGSLALVPRRCLMQSSALELTENELVTTQAHSATRYLVERKSPGLKEFEYLFWRGDFIWVSSDPINHVVPAIHSPLVVMCPRLQIMFEVTCKK